MLEYVFVHKNGLIPVITNFRVFRGLFFLSVFEHYRSFIHVWCHFNEVTITYHIYPSLTGIKVTFLLSEGQPHFHSNACILQ